MTAEEAAELIVDGDVIGSSGFTLSGYPKAVAPLIARKAKRLHEAGEPFSISLYTGASTGDEMDGELTRANALAHRIPYQSHPDLRSAINSGAVEFSDLHLSHVAQYVRAGFLKKPTVALVDAVDVTPDGHIYLSTSGGSTASYLMMADKIIVELNSYLGKEFKGFHDVFIPSPPPTRERIPIYKVDDRIGMPYVAVPMDKIVAIVFPIAAFVAAGAGASLALGCDLVYAADNARFSFIFVRRALALDPKNRVAAARLARSQTAR